MRSSGDQPAGMGTSQIAGPVQIAFRQVHAVGSDLFGQARIAADQQTDARLARGDPQSLGDFRRVVGSEMAIDHPSAGREARCRGQGIRRPGRVGEEQQGRQGPG